MTGREYRRVLMPRTRHHVYYRLVDTDLLRLFRFGERHAVADLDCARTGELEVLSRFNEVLNQVSDATPQHLPNLEGSVKTEAWRRLSAAAREALSCLLPAE